MNLVSMEAYEKATKELSLRRPLFYSTFFAVVIFILVLFSDFVAALVALIGVFIFLFVLSYGLLYMTTKSVIRKTKNFTEDVPHINVTFTVSGTYQKEQGILCFYDEHIVYKPLQLGAANKEFAMEINEDLYIGTGEYKRKRRDKYIDGPFQKHFILVKEMPHGLHRMFQFYNIDNALDKVNARIGQINQFNEAKYQ